MNNYLTKFYVVPNVDAMEFETFVKNLPSLTFVGDEKFEEVTKVEVRAETHDAFFMLNLYSEYVSRSEAYENNLRIIKSIERELEKNERLLWIKGKYQVLDKKYKTDIKEIEALNSILKVEIDFITTFMKIV